MDESFGKAGYLYVEYFFTAFLQSLSGGSERTWKSTTCAFSFGRPDVPYMKLVLTCRSFCKVSMSISLMTSCSSIVKRGDSASRLPFSAMIPLPAKTRSVLDSPKPEEA